MEEILKKAIEHYGKEHQLGVAQEELSELVTAISHYKRGREHNVAEEIADVEIMLSQLKIIFNCTDEVEEWKEKKVERLANRIKNMS